MADASLIRELEIINTEMWVANEILMLGESHLRANDGVTWRANSVLPVGPSGRSVDESIDYCIDFYSKRNVPPCFQLTTVSDPKELDSILGDRGWAKGIIVETMIMDLGNSYSHDTSYSVSLQNEPTENWMKSYIEGFGRTKGDRQTRVDLMMRSEVPKVFAQIDIDGTTASVGLGMVHQGWLGIFRIGTLSEYRNKGLATALNEALLDWGSKQHAKRAFLQVEDDDDHEGAKRLYQKIGFEYAYTYWYRYQK